MKIKEAAHSIIFSCGVASRIEGGYGPELADDHPLVVRSIAMIQEAADTYAADLKAENERLEAENSKFREALILIDDAPPIGLDFGWHQAQARIALGLNPE